MPLSSHPATNKLCGSGIAFSDRRSRPVGCNERLDCRRRCPCDGFDNIVCSSEQSFLKVQCDGAEMLDGLLRQTELLQLAREMTARARHHHRLAWLTAFSREKPSPRTFLGPNLSNKRSARTSTRFGRSPPGGVTQYTAPEGRDQSASTLSSRPASSASREMNSGRMPRPTPAIRAGIMASPLLTRSGPDGRTDADFPFLWVKRQVSAAAPWP